MTSTKVMFLGILIMLLGLALVSAATQLLVFRVMGAEAIASLEYFALAVFVTGFIVGVLGFFRE